MNMSRTNLRLLLLAAALILLAAGAARGEAQMVYNQAVNICLECIGIR